MLDQATYLEPVKKADMHPFSPIVKSRIKCLTYWVTANKEYKVIHKENRNQNSNIS